MIGEPLVEVRGSLRTLHTQEKVSFKGSPACLPACLPALSSCAAVTDTSSHMHLTLKSKSFQCKTNKSEDLILMPVTISDLKTKNLKNTRVTGKIDVFSKMARNRLA
jgi:hypothetical protein